MEKIRNTTKLAQLNGNKLQHNEISTTQGKQATTHHNKITTTQQKQAATQRN